MKRLIFLGVVLALFGCQQVDKQAQEEAQKKMKDFTKYGEGRPKLPANPYK